MEGTHKSEHTIKNYQLDLFAFRDFIQKEYAGKKMPLDQVQQADLERYRYYLRGKGFKTNTRRRKILTVTQFLGYLAKRKKLSQELGRKVPAPLKVERVPFTVSSVRLVEGIRKLPMGTVLDARNRALLWTLAETGCLVSEVTRLCYDDWTQTSPSSATVFIAGKASRSVPVSMDLYQLIQDLRSKASSSKWIFQGHNKHGSLGAPMTPRGVELLVKYYGPRLEYLELTPRTFRHSVILRWFEEGLPQQDIQQRLGLKTTYAFRSYAPLLKSSGGTTSTG